MKFYRYPLAIVLALLLWGGPVLAPVAVQASANTIVFITKTGGKYHKDGCRYLKQSKIEVTLSKAKEMGKTACKVCKPPTE